MNCKYCGATIVQEKTGKRAREYCSNAHKQADYRRRHPLVDTLQLQRELTAARMRIAELERLVTELQGQHAKRNVTVSPQSVKMWSFIHQHMPVYDEALEQMVEAARGQLQPFKDADGEEMLDVHGQRVFWECFHDVGKWQNCPDCPHEYKDTAIVRKRSDFHPSAVVKGLPEGCISIRSFAQMHGVNPTTFRDHITIGIGKGLPVYQKDKVVCSERPKSGRPHEIERYLTPEQQQAALEFWRRHRVSFQKI